MAAMTPASPDLDPVQRTLALVQLDLDLDAVGDPLDDPGGHDLEHDVRLRDRRVDDESRPAVGLARRPVRRRKAASPLSVHLAEEEEALLPDVTGEDGLVLLSAKQQMRLVPRAGCPSCWTKTLIEPGWIGAPRSCAKSRRSATWPRMLPAPDGAVDNHARPMEPLMAATMVVANV